eukprot:SAG11_NODE_106_length_16423_cov_51.220840_1_plen_105_part_00
MKAHVVVLGSSAASARSLERGAGARLCPTLKLEAVSRQLQLCPGSAPLDGEVITRSSRPAPIIRRLISEKKMPAERFLLNLVDLGPRYRTGKDSRRGLKPGTKY